MFGEMNEKIPMLFPPQFPVNKSGKELFKVVKSKFKPEEDKLLLKLVQEHGKKDWKKISKLMGSRNSRQCRERWRNYLRPEVLQTNWTEEEDMLLLRKYEEIGPKWNIIGSCFQGRSVNNIRNRWVKLMRKKSGFNRQITELSRSRPPENEISNFPFKEIDKMNEFDIFSPSRDDWDGLIYSVFFNS